MSHLSIKSSRMVVRTAAALAASLMLAGSAIAASAPAATPAPAAAPAAADDMRIIHISTKNPSAQHLTLPLNKAAVVELDGDARDVLVSNPDIADAVVRTPRRIFILSLKTGQTNAFFMDAQGRQMASLDIRVEPDVTDLNDSLSRHLPNSQVKAESLNENVVLDGTVASVQDARAAQDIASKFAGSPDKVVNKLNIQSRQQVLIKVSVSEMQRSIAKQLGVDLAVNSQGGNVPIIAATSNPFSLLGRALSNLSGVQVGNISQGSDAQAVLKALERVGLIHTLAEPNLTAVSGESAKFLAGGEFPVPSSRDNQGNVLVTYKQFGVGLAFTPIVLNDNHISLQVSTEVSELTNEGAFVGEQTTATDSNGTLVVVPGLTIPALAVRRAETTVEMPSGGSIVIGGLMRQQSKQNLDAFPGLKDLPVLGALFRSRDFQSEESELVVTVSAYLVDPVNIAQITMPDQGFAPPTDAEMTLFGRLNTVYGDGHDVVPPQAKGTTGYIVQ